MSTMAYDIPLVDLTPFTRSGDFEGQKNAATALYSACHEFGFANIIGHGMPRDVIEEAFQWSKRLFDLPIGDKMKAPHPPTAMPHRGYSKPSAEKVYSREDLERHEEGGGESHEMRQIKDFKESFEVGSEHNLAQPNIWLPERVLPGYRAFSTKLYWELEKSAKLVLGAVSLGLGLSETERTKFIEMHSGHNNQLRLLHYPPIELGRLQRHEVERMPAHQDWSSFTLDFQDSTGGLELRRPGGDGDFIASVPLEGSCIINIGDMLERATNGYFPSAMHRVGLPLADVGNVTKSRYSIPYFVAPDDDAIVETIPSLVSEDRPRRYEPVQFSDYGEWISKHMYSKGEGS